MSSEMASELLLFGNAILYGAMMMIGYDALRIFRRLICHGTIWLIAEDLLYWIIGSLFVFSKIYQDNNGEIRGYLLIGMIVGVLIWHVTIGECLVRKFSFLAKRLKFSIARGKIALRKRCCGFFRKS